MGCNEVLAKIGQYRRRKINVERRYQVFDDYRLLRYEIIVTGVDDEFGMVLFYTGINTNNNTFSIEMSADSFK